MANIVLTFTIEEAKAAQYIEAICNEVGIEPTAANTKKIIKQLIEDLIAGHERRHINIPITGIS